MRKKILLFCFACFALLANAQFDLDFDTSKAAVIAEGSMMYVQSEDVEVRVNKDELVISLEELREKYGDGKNYELFIEVREVPEPEPLTLDFGVPSVEVWVENDAMTLTSVEIPSLRDSTYLVTDTVPVVYIHEVLGWADMEMGDAVRDVQIEVYHERMVFLPDGHPGSLSGRWEMQPASTVKRIRKEKIFSKQGERIWPEDIFIHLYLPKDR